jgi:Na+/melibiose symporter-like transporter
MKQSGLIKPSGAWRDIAYSSLGIRYAVVSILWFAFFAQWLTVVPIILPEQVEMLVGDEMRKEGVTGSIVAAGAFVALLIAPLAGAVSDRSQASRGRRRPFLIWGMVGTCIGLILLIPFGPSDNLLLYSIIFLHLQFWWNVASGPYAGLIPDVVPEPDRGVASAWIIILSTIGTIAGYILMSILYSPGHPGVVILAFVAVNIICLVIALRTVTEHPPTSNPGSFQLRGFLLSFWIDPRTHQNFYWVLVTRLLVNMGIWWIFTFLSYYLKSIGVENAAKRLSMLLSLGLALGIPACLIAIRAAERYDVVKVVQITSLIMGAAVISYAPVVFAPNFAFGIVVIIVFGTFYGAYQAVDWVLALKVLPSGETAGKDMGIWHVCMVLPQIGSTVKYCQAIDHSG